MARVSTKFLMRPPYTRVWDRIPRVLWDTLADESFSPRQTDRKLLVLMCLRQGTEEEGRKLGGEPAIRFAQLLELLGIPVGQDDQVVPTDYFNGLVASAGHSPASVRGGPGQPVGQPMVPPPGDGGWQAERNFSRWRMNGTARTNGGGSHEMTHPHSNNQSF